ncbi:MAG: hypothetical protein CMI33_03875, partial [Opitutales bacterium]|nr:hypothetical protein [Opitutales bacterium]
SIQTPSNQLDLHLILKWLVHRLFSQQLQEDWHCWHQAWLGQEKSKRKRGIIDDSNDLFEI